MYCQLKNKTLYALLLKVTLFVFCPSSYRISFVFCHPPHFNSTSIFSSFIPQLLFFSHPPYRNFFGTFNTLHFFVFLFQITSNMAKYLLCKNLLTALPSILLAPKQLFFSCFTTWCIYLNCTHYFFTDQKREACFVAQLTGQAVLP